MTLVLHEDAFGDSRNAQFLAKAAELAYLPSEEGKAAYLAELGLVADLISVHNTQAWVGSDQNNIVVAFRGTESPDKIEGLKDWLLTNAMNLLVLPQGRLGTDLAAAGVGARFHQGFADAIGSVWDDVYSMVNTAMGESERPLWITGHSLGGALALFAGWLCIRKMVNVHQIYTFGAPMIGNQAAVTAFNREFKGKLFRYVNMNDPVPRLPMYSLVANEFAHCAEERILGAQESEGAESQLEWSLARGVVDGVINATLLETIWDSVQGRVAAHGLDYYRKLLG
jgi:hypothetical protein